MDNVFKELVNNVDQITQRKIKIFQDSRRLQRCHISKEFGRWWYIPHINGSDCCTRYGEKLVWHWRQI